MWSCNVFNKKPIFNKYGWKPQLPDHRDINFALNENISNNLPPTVDLRNSGFMPAIYNQGHLGSCTANSIAAAIEYDRAKQKLEVWTPSRLFIYYYERLSEGTINADCGAAIRDGYKIINTIGYAKESTWPYDIKKFNIQPNQLAQTEAALHKSIQYQSVNQDEISIKTVLAAGHVISFGISIFSSFENRDVISTGIVPIPKLNESNLGGHAILLVGYEDSEKVYVFRNSWGGCWGDNGYGYLPYDYVHNHNLASDFWVVQTVSA